MAANGENLSTAAAAELAKQAAPIYRSQRVPGARTLAPFLQAVTASQEMKVSHEVCRVMTASVKVGVGPPPGLRRGHDFLLFFLVLFHERGAASTGAQSYLSRDPCARM